MNRDKPVKNISVTPVPALEYIRAWGVPITVVSSLSTILVGVADFLSPKLKLLPPLAFIGGLAIVLVVIGRHFLRDNSTNPRLASWLGFGIPIYKAPAFNSAVIATLLFLFGSQVSNANAAKNGYLSAHIPNVGLLQEKIGLIEAVNHATQRIERKLDDVSGTLDEIRDVVTGKTPIDNPRKELASMGIQWSSLSMAQAIRRNDLTAVRLFLAGGMRADSTDGSVDNPPMAYAVAIPDDQRFEFLKLFAANGVSLGKSWSTSIQGSPVKVCLAVSCLSVSPDTCRSDSFTLPFWQQLVDVKFSPDEGCLEELGARLAGLEEVSKHTSERAKYLRKWNAEKTKRYQFAKNLQRDLSIK